MTAFAILTYDGAADTAALNLVVRANPNGNGAWPEIAAFASACATQADAPRAAIVSLACDDVIARAPGLGNIFCCAEGCEAELTSLGRPVLQALAIKVCVDEDADRLKKNRNKVSLARKILAAIEADSIIGSGGGSELDAEPTDDDIVEPLVDLRGEVIDEATLAAAIIDPEGPEAARVLGLDGPPGPRRTLPGFQGSAIPVARPAAAILAEVLDELNAADAAQAPSPTVPAEGSPADPDAEAFTNEEWSCDATYYDATNELLIRCDAVLTTPAQVQQLINETLRATGAKSLPALGRMGTEHLRRLYNAVFGPGRETQSDHAQYLAWKIRAAAKADGDKGADDRVSLGARSTTRGTTVTGERPAQAPHAWITLPLKPEQAPALDAAIALAGLTSRTSFARRAMVGWLVAQGRLRRHEGDDVAALTFFEAALSLGAKASAGLDEVADSAAVDGNEGEGEGAVEGEAPEGAAAEG